MGGKHSTGTTCKTTKKYPRVTAGPLRNQYVHRIVAAALIGRTLNRDEEVHHRDGDVRNFWFTNLHVLGSKDHGWVSAKQAYYMRQRDLFEEAEWKKFMEEEHARFQTAAQRAKNEGVPWTEEDGQMENRWNKYYPCATINA